MLNSIARQNNNPGNLRSWPNRPTRKGYARFTRAEEGWSALYQQIESNIFGQGAKDPYRMRSVGLSLREFFQGQRDTSGNLILGGYPGYDSNNNIGYADYVAKVVGLPDIDVKLKDYID